MSQKKNRYQIAIPTTMKGDIEDVQLQFADTIPSHTAHKLLRAGIKLVKEKGLEEFLAYIKEPDYVVKQETEIQALQQ